MHVSLIDDAEVATAQADAAFAEMESRERKRDDFTRHIATCPRCRARIGFCEDGLALMREALR